MSIWILLVKRILLLVLISRTAVGLSGLWSRGLPAAAGLTAVGKYTSRVSLPITSLGDRLTQVFQQCWLWVEFGQPIGSNRAREKTHGRRKKRANVHQNDFGTKYYM